MDINVTLKLEGLDPLANAINALAAAYTGSGAVIEKAKTSSKKTAATLAPAPTSPAEEATQESQAPAAQETATESPSEEKSSAEPAEKSTSSVSAQAITDEQLRAAAATAARRDKEKVKALVNKYAANVTSIAASDRPAFIKELEEV